MMANEIKKIAHARIFSDGPSTDYSSFPIHIIILNQFYIVITFAIGGRYNIIKFAKIDFKISETNISVLEPLASCLQC